MYCRDACSLFIFFIICVRIHRVPFKFLHSVTICKDNARKSYSLIWPGSSTLHLSTFLILTITIFRFSVKNIAGCRCPKTQIFFTKNDPSVVNGEQIIQIPAASFLDLLVSEWNKKKKVKLLLSYSTQCQKCNIQLALEACV